MLTLARKQIWKAWAVGPAGREGADEQDMTGYSQELHVEDIPGKRFSPPSGIFI